MWESISRLPKYDFPYAMETRWNFLKLDEIVHFMVIVVMILKVYHFLLDSLEQFPGASICLISLLKFVQSF